PIISFSGSSALAAPIAKPPVVATIPTSEAATAIRCKTRIPVPPISYRLAPELFFRSGHLQRGRFTPAMHVGRLVIISPPSLSLDGSARLAHCSFACGAPVPTTVERFLSLGFINAGLLPIAGSLHSGDCQRSRTQSPVHRTETIEFHR